MRSQNIKVKLFKFGEEKFEEKCYFLLSATDNLEIHNCSSISQTTPGNETENKSGEIKFMEITK